MDYLKVFDEFEKIHKSPINRCSTIDLKRICLKCCKKMKPIKNDFPSREYCKKCHKEIEDDRRLLIFLVDVKYGTHGSPTMR